jgi:CheY-like chemotaxis protein
MRILICEDSQQNLQSAREFAETVKGEHEVEIADDLGAGIASAGYVDCVLTDCYLPDYMTGEIIPGGLLVALAALGKNVPVCIITDGANHGPDRLICMTQLLGRDKRLQVRVVNADGDGSRDGIKGMTPDGKIIKDWEYCFRELMEKSVTA